MIDFSSEITYKTSRSSGAGGQNVNKVETAVMALWVVEDSAYFNADQKAVIIETLKNHINKKGELHYRSERYRTQLQNKEAVTKKMLQKVNAALRVDKKRIPTKPSKAQKERRLKAKKKASEKKENRRFKY